MKFRKIFRTVSVIATLSITSDTILPPVNMKCEESVISPSYVAGKGTKLIDCIKNIYKTEYQRLRDFIGIRDTTMPRFRYDTIEGIFLGSYDVINDIITFDTSKVLYSPFGGYVSCNTILSHEYVHHFLNKKSQEIENGKWPRISTNDRKRFTLDDYGIQLISEGLATYIGDKIRIPKIYTKWPTSREEFYCSISYILGNYLITPIMNEYGADAIKPIILRPPRNQEIFFPEMWQDKIKARIIRERTDTRK